MSGPCTISCRLVFIPTHQLSGSTRVTSCTVASSTETGLRASEPLLQASTSREAAKSKPNFFIVNYFTRTINCPGARVMLVSPLRRVSSKTFLYSPSSFSVWVTGADSRFRKGWATTSP